MKVIHFTEGAAEPFESSQVSLAKFIPLLQGTAETYVTCLHFLPGASVVERSPREPRVGRQPNFRLPLSPGYFPGAQAYVQWVDE